MNYTTYAKNFRSRRKALLKKANNQCERCGVPNRSFAFNREGEVYIIYLHAAHVFREQKGDPDALLVLLCPKCHSFFDHPRKKTTEEGKADWAFIGAVERRIAEQSQSSEQQEVSYGTIKAEQVV